MAAASPLKPAPTLAQAARLWFKIGCLGFGGPAGQIALLHRLIVEEKGWIAEGPFLQALNFCMLLPGPEAQQLATYLGWRLHGTKGGLIAGMFFILPGAILIWILSAFYAYHRETDLLRGIFFGLKAAVLALVIEAVLRLARRTLKTRRDLLLAIGAFLALAGFAIPFPLVILIAAAIGAMRAPIGRKGERDSISAPPPSPRRWRQVFIALALWLGPIGLLVTIFGPAHIWSEIGLFFTQTAVLTFGGAYAILGYVATAAVQHHRWLQPSAMIDGLALAETTPGPLILVLSYVGFLAAFDHAGPVDPLAAGTIGFLIASFATFAPSFVAILLAAPYVERWSARPLLAGALAGIGAATVGIVANLGFWFGLHVLFRDFADIRWGPIVLKAPLWASLDLGALALAIAAAASLLRFRLGLVKLLLMSAFIGWLVFLGRTGS